MAYLHLSTYLTGQSNNCMTTRTKVLVVNSDLDTLSKIYLALIHRNYKVEATDKIEEIYERIKRLKPVVIVISFNDYKLLKTELKIPAIVLADHQNPDILSSDEVVVLQKPYSFESLGQMIDTFII